MLAVVRRLRGVAGEQTLVDLDRHLVGVATAAVVAQSGNLHLDPFEHDLVAGGKPHRLAAGGTPEDAATRRFDSAAGALPARRRPERSSSSAAAQQVPARASSKAEAQQLHLDARDLADPHPQGGDRDRAVLPRRSIDAVEQGADQGVLVHGGR